MIDRTPLPTSRAADAQRGIRLTVTGPKLRVPQEVQVRQPFAVVGRAAKADVRLRDLAVSFRHVYLQVLDDGVYCIDLASKAGTVWRDAQRSHGWLADGEVLHVGPYALRLATDRLDAQHSSDEPDVNPLDVESAPDPPHYEIEFQDETHPEPIQRIDRCITLIGRRSMCQVCVSDESVSRMHCALVRAGNALWVVDLLGRGGTRLNDRKVRFGRLENGSELVIGNHAIVIRECEAGDDGSTIDELLADAHDESEPLPVGQPGVEDQAQAVDWLGTLFSVERRGATLIIVPTISTGMFRYAKLQTEANALRRRLESSDIQGLIVDLHAVDYVGAEVIGAVVALARKAEESGGRAVLCRPAPQLREAMTNMGLHRLWMFYGSREEALQAVQARH